MSIEELEARIKALEDRVRGPQHLIIQQSVDPTGEVIEGPHIETVLHQSPARPGSSVADWMVGVAGLPPVVVDPGMARSGPCIAVELGDDEQHTLIFQKGISGALDQEQQALYCTQGVESVPLDEIQKNRLRLFRQAAATCATTGMTGERGAEMIGSYFSCLERELSQQGI